MFLEGKKHVSVDTNIDQWLKSVDGLADDLKKLNDIKQRVSKKIDTIKSKTTTSSISKDKEKIKDKEEEDKKEDELVKKVKDEVKNGMPKIIDPNIKDKNNGKRSEENN